VVGAIIHISGLWGLMVGTGSASGGDANALYFTAGIAGPDTVESHGLLGDIVPAPALSTGGIVNAASFTSAIAPGAFTAIFGSGLASTRRTWGTADFAGGKLPVTLDGVSVTIDGKPAYVYYVSPEQIDVIAPADTASGAVPVVVTNNGVAAASTTAALQSAAPAFFAVGKYAIATHANGSLVTPANPAAIGEVVALYGTGFGPTSPAVDGLVVTAPANLATAPAVTIGTAAATVQFAGLSAAGLNQINVTVPPLPAGSHGVVDVPIAARIGTAGTPAGLFISVQSGN